MNPPIPDDLKRYRRQIALPEIGIDGQERLRRARVLCVGAGGLGSPALLYLAAAGVGHLGVIDPDLVEVSNLQRQILFESRNQGSPKARLAKERLLAINPEISCTSYDEALTSANAMSIVKGYDLILDGTDNFESKYLVNDVAFKFSIPLVHAAVSGFEGRIAIFSGSEGPCYRCLYPRRPQADVQNCGEAGVLGPVVGMVGMLQALEAIRLLVPRLQGKPGRLIVWDALENEMTRLEIERVSDCKTCSRSKDSISLPSEEEFDVAVSDGIWIDVRTEQEWSQGHIRGAIHWPLERMERGEFPAIDPSLPVTLYCQSGFRSRRALGLFQARGAILARHLETGYAGWSNRGMAKGICGEDSSQ